ncbi:MAG: DUF1232 domain-containing protein [Planctomycetes bacterium]|nr:DUF1232 domain-containing protein [Planctomycetota bacterium]
MNLVDKAKAIWNMFRSGNSSKMDKWILALTLLYCLSPFDIIPDVVPIVGMLDDLLVVLMSFKHFSGKVADKPQPAGGPAETEVEVEVLD